MKRLPDWRARYEALIDEIKRTPFEWGVHDCGPGLAGRAVMALTGEDIAAPYAGKYKTAKGALKLMKSLGFSDLGDAVASMLPEIEPAFAHIGDLAAIPSDGEFGVGLGIIDRERVFVLTPNGLGTVDRRLATRAFKVG